jgi:hypothetical protein
MADIGDILRCWIFAIWLTLISRRRK